MIINRYEESQIKNSKLPLEWQSQASLDELADFLHNFHSETITTVILSMSPQLISQLDCALILLSLQDFQLINHLIIYCIVN